MTRKGYERIAEVIRKQRDEHQDAAHAQVILDSVATALAHELEDLDRDFNVGYFLTACEVGLEEMVHSLSIKRVPPNG